MFEDAISLIGAVLAGILASIVISFLGKWLSNWRWEITLKIGTVRVAIDLSDPDQIPAALDAHTQSPQVFLAYSHKDREYADRLATDLKDRGIRVWYDIYEIRPGDSILQRLNDGLSTSGYMLAVLSEASVASHWATKEMEMAMQRESKGKWPRVIPVLIDNVQLPAFLASKVYIDLRENYEHGLERIIQAIRSAGETDAVPSSG